MTYILRHQGPRAQQSTMNSRLWLKGSSWRKRGVELGMKRERTVADISAEEEAPVIWLWGEPRQESYPQMTRHAYEWSSSWIGHGLQTASPLTLTSLPDTQPLCMFTFDGSFIWSAQIQVSKSLNIVPCVVFLAILNLQTPLDFFFFAFFFIYCQKNGTKLKRIIVKRSSRGPDHYKILDVTY